MSNKLTILRTAVGSPVAPFILKELSANLDCRLIGTDLDELACGKQFCDQFYVVKRALAPGYIDDIIDICRKESVDVFWPDLDEELVLVANNIHSFKQLGVKVVISGKNALETCVSKFNTYQFFTREGIPCPETFDNINDNDLRMPYIIKPDYGRGSQGVHIIQSQKDLDYYWSTGYVLQKLLKGKEHTVDAFSDFSGKFIYASIRERVATDSGISIKSKTVKNDDVIQYVAKACNALKLKGPSCFQYFESDTGEINFIEINPRIAGTAAISVLAGAPLITDTIKAVLNQHVSPPQEYKLGFSASRYWSEVEV